MAKTLIGNVKGKDGRGISKIEKTATTGVVDTYTITYTDGTQSTYEMRNSDDIAIQRQIVPSAAVESSATASQSYASGDYVAVNGVLRKVKASISKGNQITDSNSTATTVTGELVSLQNSFSNIITGIITGRVGPQTVAGQFYAIFSYDVGKALDSSAVVIATCRSASADKMTCSFASLFKFEGTKVFFRADNRGTDSDDIYIDFVIFEK